MQLQQLFTFASETEASPGLLQALGLDGMLLAQQLVAFLILVGILGKFVYPALIKAVDARREQIEAGVKEAKQAEEALGKAEEKVAGLLAEARTEADSIVARSHQEAAAMVAEAEEKAKQRAEHIVADARTQLDADIRRARQTLKTDTIQLVALATERIVGEKLDQRKDTALIEQALASPEGRQ